MKPAETARIYQAACKAKRQDVSDDQGRHWHRVLREFEARDVETALEAWWADTSLTASGRPRGAYLPEPQELKNLAEHARRKREAAAREPQDVLMWQCKVCMYRAIGFIAHGATPPIRKCPRDGSHLALEKREAA